MLFTDEYLNRILGEAEEDLSRDLPLIFARSSLATTSGTSVYDISSYKINTLLQVSWKGYVLDPFEHAQDREEGATWFKPQDQGNTSRPHFYLSYEYGHAKIKFHPIPNETIAADDSDIYGAGADDLVVLTYFRLAETAGTSYRVPDFFRRATTKYSAMQKAYLREGKTQDIKASRYFRGKNKFFYEKFKQTVSQFPKSITYQFGESTEIKSGRLVRPSMPSGGAWDI
jgi:hypothetical protein